MWEPSIAHTQLFMPFRDANCSRDSLISVAVGSRISHPYLPARGHAWMKPSGQSSTHEPGRPRTVGRRASPPRRLNAPRTKYTFRTAHRTSCTWRLSPDDTGTTLSCSPRSLAQHEEWQEARCPTCGRKAVHGIQVKIGHGTNNPRGHPLSLPLLPPPAPPPARSTHHTRR